MSDYRRTPFWSACTTLATVVDRYVGWDRLPVPLGLAVLIGLRTALRQENLHEVAVPSVGGPTPAPASAQDLVARTADGSHNDLRSPATGMAGSRFGRNVDPAELAPEHPGDLLDPNPREVSRALLTRTEFAPASGANSLVAAWLQFMIRDWFSHGTSPTDRPWEVPLADDDPWPERPMRILRTPEDPTRPEGAAGPQTRVNVLTHWWDGSQIYGTSPAEQEFVRLGEGGRLRVGDDGLLPVPPDPAHDPARIPGFWIGTELLRTLFTREHNAVCARLAAAYPSWDDEALFGRARLVVAALLAKIHTVEWTPAVISHPTTAVAMRANWFGLAGERLHRLLGRVSASEAVSGIPGSHTDHYGVPYALTEEFVAVYRMHPLIRDDWSFRAAADDTAIRECTFAELAGPKARAVLSDIAMEDLLYSFGTQPPGLVQLHNFPRFLQEFERPDGHRQDLGATDILRSRELGVPRYNAFRRMLRLAPARTFSELTDNPEWAREIERVYGGDVEKVDLSVGMFAERRPQGFAFSDTAFRIFILMASRRLNSDRFFTEHFTPAVYTPEGMDWIADNSMATVLLRHHPELRPALVGVGNAFAAWRATRAGAP